MYNLKLNEQQVKYLYHLLDGELRHNGLGSLESVVALKNVLLTLEHVEDPKVDQPKENSQSVDEGA